MKKTNKLQEKDKTFNMTREDVEDSIDASLCVEESVKVIINFTTKLLGSDLLWKEVHTWLTIFKTFFHLCPNSATLLNQE